MIGFGVFALACVVIAVAAPMPYLTRSLDRLAAGDDGLAAHYVAQPTYVARALVVHAAAGGVGLLLTPVQWSARLRRRWPRAHRIGGRLAAAAIMVAAASGLVLAWFSYAGWVGTAGFSALAVLWAWCCGQMVHHARAGRLAVHRRWAVRTTALTFAAVTLRVWVGIGIAIQQPATDAAAEVAFDRVYGLTPFLCWVPNLVVAEWTLRSGRRRSTPAAAAR